MNRAQIICDVLALEKAGHMSLELREDVLSYLSEENDFGAILAFERCSVYARGDLAFDETELFRI